MSSSFKLFSRCEVLNNERNIGKRSILRFLVVLTVSCCFMGEYYNSIITKYTDHLSPSHEISNPVSNVVPNMGFISTTWHNRSANNYNLSGVNFELKDTQPLKSVIDDVNRRQYVINAKFTPDTPSTGIVMLIQIHTRVNELRLQIQSLKDVKGIENSLVIFSHDVFLPHINKIIEDIDFCPVMQIVFPYSIQVYNGSFPADSPNDCLRNTVIKKAKELGCNNADYPDRYGHYRKAHFTQMKHHWLWKINFVFNELRIMSDFNGTLLRLDNDYYLGPDILHVMKLMNNLNNTRSDKMLIMGSHEIFSNEDYNSASYSSRFWFTGVGRGMGFSKQLWNRISGCGDIFCTFDDYNWDWSLEKAVTACINEIHVLQPKGSRIFHIGQCHGFHNHNKCSTDELIRKIKRYLNANRQHMFPKNMTR